MLILLVLSLFLIHIGLGDQVVQIQNGIVNGTTMNTPSGQTFYTWRGIPYGKPPVDNLRYLPPVKAEPWDGVLDASRDSPACIFFGNFPGDPPPTNGHSEDCLYINVHSPVPVGSNSSVNATRSVMFWIYGGGYYSGTSDILFYDPTPLVEQDVVVVTFNYRLGYFGFLSTGDEVVLGNAGLKDQLLALQWTRDNIAFFGGNPDAITIFGESAGAVSVGYHLVSQLSRNLFKGAIMQSGYSIFNEIQKDGRDYAFRLASRINSSITNTSTSEEVRDVLQAAPAELILNLTNTSIRVTPVLEVVSNLSFLTTLIYETIEAGDFARVPTILGYNSEEYIFFANDLERLQREANQDDIAPENLVPRIPLKDNVSAEAIGREIHERYAGQGNLFTENLAAYVRWASDNLMVRGTYKQAALQSRFSPVFMYRFSFDGTTSKNNVDIPGAGKVGHAQEVGYLFNVTTHLETENDFLTRRRLTTLWTNFAKTSNPTPDDESAELLQNVKWEPIIENDIQILDISENLEIIPNPKRNDSIFWDYIWETYSYRPYNTY